MRDLAANLHGEFSPDYKIKLNQLNYCTFRMAAIFIAEAKGLIPIWDKTLIFDNSLSKNILGIDYISA